MLNKKLKKVISSVTMFATVVALSGVSALAPITASAATTIVDGDLISSNATNSDGTPTYESLDIYIVKIVGNKKFKRLVLNPTIFNSYQHLKWENIKEVDPSVLDEYKTSYLARVDGDEKVYALTPDDDSGSKSWIDLTAAEFLGLEDSDPDSIYTINAVDGATYSKKANIDTVAALEAFYEDGTLPEEEEEGDIKASLAANTPESGTIVAGQGMADLAHFKLSGDGKVKSVVLKRTGVSADSTLSNVYLFDGETRLTDAASVTSGSLITFSDASGLFEVDGSMIISVKADIATGTSGQTVGVELKSITLKDGSVASGTPVEGNLQSIATASLATVAMSNATGSGNADPGEGITVWQGTATVGTRDVILNRLALRQIGSIASADIENFTLFIDGTEVESEDELDANGYVTFDVSKALKSGARTLKVTADVIGGSGRTVQMSLRGAYDISTTDTQYNAGVLATGTFPFGPSAFTVNAGTMTVVKSSDSPSQNITKGATDVSLAKFDFVSYGENIKVETLTVDPTVTGGGADTVTLQNVKVFVDGSQVGSTTSITAEGTASFTTNFTVVPGTVTKVEIRGDVVDSEGTDEINSGAVTSIQMGLNTGSGNAIPKISLGTINVPSSDVDGNDLTVASGSISLAKTSTYGDKTVVIPASAYKIASYQLSGNSTEKVTLNNIEVDLTGTGGFDPSDDLSDLYVKYGTSQTSVKGSVADTDNTWSISKELGVNETMAIDVYASIKSTASDGDGVADTIAAAVTVTGITAQSSATVYADSDTTNSDKNNGVSGQTITVGTGTITVSKASTTPNAAIVEDNTTPTTAIFKFESTNDSYTVTELKLLIADATTVDTVTLSGTGFDAVSRPGSTAVTFTGLNIPVAANGSNFVQVKLALGTVGSGAGVSGSEITTTLDYAKARNSAGTTGNVTEATDNPAGNAMYVYKAIPTITAADWTETELVNGNSKDIAKVKVASSGEIAWKEILFSFSGSGSTRLTNATLWDGSTEIAGTDTVTEAASGTIKFVATSEQLVNGEKTYTLKADISGAVAADSLGVNIAHLDTVYGAPDDYTTIAGTGSFIWSDLSATGHSNDTTDWNTDFLVNNLPTTSQSLK